MLSHACVKMAEIVWQKSPKHQSKMGWENYHLELEEVAKRLIMLCCAIGGVDC